MKNKGRGKSERYVWLRFWLLDTLAWKSLPVGARALYIELARRYNGNNNGRISFSVREAMQALGVSRGQAKYLFDMLLDRGFVICTSKGAFSLKTERDATEWRITEYPSDHPPAHATKDFMRWNGDFETVSQFRGRKGEPRPRMTGADKERARRFENRTRFTAVNRTVHSHEPHGSQPKTVKPKKRQNGSQPKTVNAKNDPITVHSNGHLQLPGRGCEPSALLPPGGGLAERKPWTTPTVEEIPRDTLLTEFLGRLDRGGGAALAEPAARTNGARHQAATEKQPDTVADVPDQAEAPAAAVDSAPNLVPSAQTAETAQTPVTATGGCVVCDEDPYRCIPRDCPRRR